MEFNNIPVLHRETTADYVDYNNNQVNDSNRLLDLLDSLHEDIETLEKFCDNEEEESEINWSFSDDLVIPENIWDPNIENAFACDDSVELDDLVVSEMTSENADSTNTECCICFEIIDKKKNNCITECGHSFCLKCLATSMYHNNNSCPCCRTALVDTPEEDEESYNEDDEDEDEDDDYTTDVEGSEEDEDRFYVDCNIEEVTRRLEANGFTMMEIISMLIGRYSRDEKYTMEYIHEMNQKFDQILDEADRETYEQKMFAAEDMRDPPESILGL